MTDNIYAAPRANLDDHAFNIVDDRFYVVAPRKMMILFFMTFGLYQLHWNFQNWARHRRATGESVWPLPRALFAIFFTHSLYHNIAKYDATGQRGKWDNSAYANGMVFLMLVGYVLSIVDRNSMLVDVLSLLLLVPIGLLMKQVQVEVNARSGDPAGSSNEKFTVANYIWCTLGGLFWVLGLIGIFFAR